jgi:putative phage-type endonuclease
MLNVFNDDAKTVNMENIFSNTSDEIAEANEVKQKTDAWFAMRCGKFTGSRFSDVLAVSKSTGKPLKAREDLIWDIASERIQGYQPQGASSYSLQWGTDNEPIARDAYEFKTGNFVEEVPFIQHPQFDFVGISPDGIISGMKKGIEIKCPKSPKVHLQRWLNGVPDEYIPQIQGSIWVAGADEWDFISHDPDTEECFKTLIITVKRDQKFIDDLERQVLLAEAEVQSIIKQLREVVRGKHE